MQFWKINEPTYQSDYKSNYINGSAYHSFGLPGVICDICGQTWGGSRILKQNCPTIFRKHKNIIDRWPIKRIDHEKLQNDLCNNLNIDYDPFKTFRPGDSFQPCFIDIPSSPSYDFLWSSIGSLIVSERILSVLQETCINEFEYSEVVFRKVGKGKPSQKPMIPSTGEPEDQINEISLLENNNFVNKYFEIMIKNETEYPKGNYSINICAGCKRENIESKKRVLKMDDSLWKGNQIFFMKTTLSIYIVNDLKIKLEKLNPTNVIFKNL